MDGLSPREALFNKILDTIEENGGDMQVNMVRAVVAEVDGAIARAALRADIGTAMKSVGRKKPRGL